MVLGLLDDVATKLAFSTVRGAKRSQTVSSEEVRNLCALERVLARAHAQRNQLGVAIREVRGEGTTRALSDARETHAKFLNATENLYRRLTELAPVAAVPGVLESFARTGLIGRRNDLKAVEEAQAHVRKVQAVLPRTVEGLVVTRRLVSAELEDEQQPTMITP